MKLKLLMRTLLAATLMLGVSAPCTEALAAEATPQVSRTRQPKKKSATTKTDPKKAAEKTAKKAQNTQGSKKTSKPVTKPADKAPKETAPGRYRAFKVNVPYAAAVIQNLAFEWQTGKKMTVDIPVMWSFSDLTDRHGVRTIALQPEARWWPGANLGSGHFLGAHLNLAWFNVRWNDIRYQASSMPLLGAGISYGYHLNFTRNWAMEFNIGAGYAYMEYDRFYNIDNGAKINRESRHYFGLTRVGLSLVYSF